MWYMVHSGTEIPPGQTPLDRDPLDRNPPGQRPPGHVIYGVCWDRDPPGQTPLDRDPLDRDPLDRDSPGQRPPGQRPPWTETPLVRDPPGHVMCGACWNKDPLSTEWHTGVKTLACCHFVASGKKANVSHTQLIISHKLKHKIHSYVRYINIVNVVLFVEKSIVLIVPSGVPHSTQPSGDRRWRRWQWRVDSTGSGRGEAHRARSRGMTHSSFPVIHKAGKIGILVLF